MTMTNTEIIKALADDMILESDDGKRYVAQEDMAGGKYGCWVNDEEGHGIVKLTNDINEAVAFVS